jgi:hypothetical protein
MRLGRFALLFLLLPLGPPAQAQEPAPGTLTPERLPRGWCGVFRWDSDGIAQYITLSFVRVERRADGKIEAFGPGLVRTYRTTRITMRAVIDPITRAVEMFERLMDDTPNWVDDGVHAGELSADFETMRLVWTTRGTGERGRMVLTARPPQADLRQDCGLPSV